MVGGLVRGRRRRSVPWGGRPVVFGRVFHLPSPLPPGGLRFGAAFRHWSLASRLRHLRHAAAGGALACVGGDPPRLVREKAVELAACHAPGGRFRARCLRCKLFYRWRSSAASVCQAGRCRGASNTCAGPVVAALLGGSPALWGPGVPSFVLGRPDWRLWLARNAPPVAAGGIVAPLSGPGVPRSLPRPLRHLLRARTGRPHRGSFHVERAAWPPAGVR